MNDAKKVFRKRVYVPLAPLFAAVVLWGCASSAGEAERWVQVSTPVVGADRFPKPAPIHVTLIQLNDIYEITPVSGGRWGGPARVATVRKGLTEKNPNTFTLLAGDLFSPSALGTARVDGERLAGRQMVAVLTEVDGAPGALLNSGSIRIDDVITPGPISQYDVIRILPFGGPVLAVEMHGSLLLRVLDLGERNKGGGGFLQRAGLKRDDGGPWLVGAEEIDPGKTYTLAVADYLVSGNEQGFDFLNRDNPGLKVLGETRDIRLALFDELRRRFSGG